MTDILRPLTVNNIELRQLRTRVKAQRRELRILNKQIAAYYAGFYSGATAARENITRAKMVKAFGELAVIDAERL